MENYYKNLEACQLEVKDECLGCTSLKVCDENIDQTLNAACGQIYDVRFAVDALLARVLEKSLGDQSGVVDRAQGDYLNEVLIQTLKTIMGQVALARNLQRNCLGVKQLQGRYGTNCGSGNLGVPNF